MFTVSQSRRSGFVLVSVLMLGAMLIACATAFAWFARMQLKSATREKTSLRSRSMAYVLTKEAMKGIKSNTIIKYDSPLLEWFQPVFFPVEDSGVCVVHIVPLDDKIPLRNLFLPDGSTLRNELRGTWEDMWLRLERRELGYTVLDFLDKDLRPKMGGVERETHINRPPLDMSELLILEEITAEILYGIPEKPGLADYCTLWSKGKVNLNMVPAHVIEILPGMDRPLAEKIVDYRGQQALTGMDDLSKIPGFPPKSRAALMNIVDFASQYFMVKIEIQEENGGGMGFNAVFDKMGGTIVHWEEI